MPIACMAGTAMKHARSLLYCLCVSLVAACGGGDGSSAPPIVVTVAPPVASVMVGEQIQLTATTTGTGPVTWSSSNTAVATVNPSGLVTVFTLGQVIITATSAGQTGTAVLSTTTGIVFASVSAGEGHTCGVTPDGVAYCWGDNSSGQLGNGTSVNSATPVPVLGGLGFSSVSAGGNQTCGVTSFNLPSGPFAGTLYCWGNNSSGQLGNGTTTNSAAPVLVAVAGGLLFASVSVGGKHVCGAGVALNNGGTRCWGDNSFGQLGNGTLTNTSIPVVPLFPYSDQGGVSAGSNHTCSVVDRGSGFAVIPAIVCWGDNSFGELGNGTTTNSAVPVLANVGYNAGSVSAGVLYSCVPGECWGNNGVGQLGDGTTTNSATPGPVSGGLDFASMNSGGDHTCALTSVPGSIAYCWGGNAFGQLGNGTMTTSTTPAAVTGGLTFATVSAGGHHSCGVVLSNLPGTIASGAVYCWGDNTSGQLGNSWTAASSVPVNVAGSQ